MADQVQPGGDPQRAPTPPSKSRDAIIFVPGLADQGIGPDQTVEGVSRRLSNALNHRAKTASAVFRTEVREQAYGPNDCFKSRVATVFRRDGDNEVALMDIYGMDYNLTLTSRFEKQNVLVKFLLALLQLVYGLGLLLPRRRGKYIRAKLQVLYAGSILFLLAAYMVILLVAAFDVAVSAVGVDHGTTATGITLLAPSPPGAASEDKSLMHRAGKWVQSVPGALGAWYRPYREFIRGLIVLFAALGVTFRNSLKVQLSAAATTYLCALYYIRLGERRNELIAKLEAMLERTAELKGVRYDRTHIVAFSFGSVLVMDALFRLGKEPPPSRFGLIKTLITIGCPFDLIRTYWPRYFMSRTALPAEPDQSIVPRWVNIYSLADVLGSNFRNDDIHGPAKVGVQLAGDSTSPRVMTVRMPDNNLLYEAGAASAKALGVWEFLTFIGFRAHSLYWNREDEPSLDCFTQVVETLYKGGRELL